jgi:hypothetical protein
MRPFRFSIAAMMGLVVIAALGAAILRQGLEASAAVVFLVTGAALCLAIVGLVCRDKTERAWWLGVNLFGWGYFKLAVWGWPWQYWAWLTASPGLPTTIALESLGLWIGIPAMESGPYREPWSPFLDLGHCLWALAAALLGGILAHSLMGASASRSNELPSDPRPVSVPSRGWWARPSIILSTGFLLVTSFAVAGSRLASGFWAGTTCLLTWGLAGVACAGALVSRGKQREIYLGAGLFGLGFMLSVFTRSAEIYDRPRPWELPVEPFLNSVRSVATPVLSGGPAGSSRVAVANSRIFRALERKVPVRFTDVPLGDFLNYVRERTKDGEGHGIPLYVDPVGMQECEQTLDSIVSIDLVDAPLKTSLDAALSQLNLKYAVRDGLLMIAVGEGEELTIYSDPYLVGCACLLALIAMALGAVLGPVACAFPGRSVA